MKYKIFDHQLKCYAFQEHIFKNKKDAIERLINYFSIDCYGDLNKIRDGLWKENNFFDLIIEKQVNE